MDWEKFKRRLTIVKCRLMFWWYGWKINGDTRACWRNYIETGNHCLPSKR